MSTSNTSDNLADKPAEPAQEPILIARQPIMDAKRAIVAYELFDRSVTHGAHNAASDIAMVFSAMTHTGKELPFGTADIFINSTHQSLVCFHLDLVQPEKLVLEVGPVPDDLQEDIETLQHTLADLHKRGFRLAFGHQVLAPAYAGWQALADYVRVDLVQLKPAEWQATVAAAKAQTKAQVIAQKVETEEQFNTLRSYGATLFQGYWVAHPDVIQTKVVSPAQASILQLFNLARDKGSLEDIEVVLKKDAVLGFNLMRLINSSGFGLAREVTSFRHAVMMMGMDKLFRWAALLLTASRANGVSAVVGTTAVVRGRMMELLATGHLTPQECDGAFVVGIFSLLEDMLGLPMAQALEMLHLPPAVSDALRDGSGIYGPILALAIACENADDEAFSAALATLNYSNHHINMAHMEALVWADSLEM